MTTVASQINKSVLKERIILWKQTKARQKLAHIWVDTIKNFGMAGMKKQRSHPDSRDYLRPPALKYEVQNSCQIVLNRLIDK